MLHSPEDIQTSPEPPLQPAALVWHFCQERHRVQPDDVTERGCTGSTGGYWGQLPSLPHGHCCVRDPGVSSSCCWGRYLGMAVLQLQPAAELLLVSFEGKSNSDLVYLSPEPNSRWNLLSLSFSQLREQRARPTVPEPSESQQSNRKPHLLPVPLHMSDISRTVAPQHTFHKRFSKTSALFSFHRIVPPST